ncbi:MAG: AAA family ATPase, partial [Planctomycetes bacterium]|nr:AAA family ATPase [Planctomycetota bacterium]
MIIRSIAVEAWGPYLRRTALEDLSDRINVISGPNETGKSTLARAIARGLLDRHGVTGHEIETVRSWGRDLAPRIEIVFEHDGERYRLAKRFLKDPSCALEREEGGRFAPLADGDEAEARVRAILGATLPGRGATKPEHWGIGQLLWAAQGAIGIGEVSAGAEERLRRTLGAVASDAAGSRIEARIEEEYGKLYTRTGKLRTGRDAAPPVALDSALDEVGEKLREAREAAIAFEEASRAVEMLRAARERLSAERTDKRSRLESLEGDAKRYGDLERERERLEAECQAKEKEYAARKKRAEDLEAARREARDIAAEIERLRSALPGLEQALETAEAASRAAESSLGDARAGRERIREARAIAADARRLAEIRAGGAALDETLRKLAELEAAREAKAKDRAALSAPARAELSEIRKLIEARDAARIRREAGCLAVEIEAARDLAIEVEAGDPPGPRALRAGETLRATGDAEVAIRIEGAGRIRARPAAAPAGEIRRELADIEERIRRCCDPFGTDDLARLEALTERAEAIEREMAQLDRERDALLDGHAPEEIEGERLRARTEEAAILARRAAWRDGAADADALARETDEAERVGDAACLEAEGAWERAVKDLETRRGSVATGRSLLAAKEIEGERIERRVAELSADGIDDAARAKGLDDLALAIHGVREALRRKREEIEAFAEDPRQARDRIRVELDRIAGEEREAIEKESQAKGILDAKGRDGVYSRVAVLEEEQAVVAGRLAREKRRAEAIALLRAEVRGGREALVAEILAPVRRHVARNVRRLIGPRYAEPRFRDGFIPNAIALAAGEQDIDLDALSYGTEEQLFLLVRLALAETIAASGREVLILDDPLVHTDPDRMER